MDAKSAGNLLLLVGRTTAAIGGSHLLRVAVPAAGASLDESLPRTDLAEGPANAAAVHRAIAAGVVRSAHDCSEGGLLVAAAEMAFAGGVGVVIDLDAAGLDEPVAAAFAETPSRYLLEVERSRLAEVAEALGSVPWTRIGEFRDGGEFELASRGDRAAMPVAHLEAAWRGEGGR